MTRKQLRIAISQSSISADVKANGAHIRELMRRAHDDGARLVHFPEGALSGYVKTQINNWDEVDWKLVCGELDAVRQMAASLGIWTVVGCNHRLTARNRPHNSLFVFSDDGRIATRYDKRLCSFTEITDWYSPGFEPCTFEVDGFRFGCALCIEIQYAEIFAEYERAGVDCVLFSAYSNDPMFWTQSKGHAAGNNFWISVSTPAQCSGQLPSGLIGPNGHPIGRAKGNGEADVVVAPLDKAAPEFDIALNKARPWRREARGGEIYGQKRVDDPRSRDRRSL